MGKHSEKVILFLVLTSFSFLLSAQSISLSLPVKDTTDLKAIIELELSKLAQTKRINPDTTMAILNNALKLGDTTIFFYFYEKITRNFPEEYSLYEEELIFNKELKEKNEELSDVIKKRKRTIYIILPTFIMISSLLMLQLVNNQRYKRLNELLKTKTKELENSNEHLAKSNEELERFAFIASHDLKTPLGNVINFTHLLERELKPYGGEKALEYLSFIKKGGERLNNLIIDTLEYSRLSYVEKTNQKQTIDLNILLGELQNSMQSYIEERNASIILPDNLPSIKADHSAIFLLFQNLLENGMKYNNSKTPTIEIYLKESDEFISVSIEDNGLGIPEEHHNEVFVMFSRLHNKREYEGSGLGLSICKKIVEKLHGEICIQSKMGEGSIFEIKLPHDLIIKKTLV